MLYLCFQVYSIVHGVLRVELIEQAPGMTDENINTRLINDNFADQCAESFLSKVSRGQTASRSNLVLQVTYSLVLQVKYSLVLQGQGFKMHYCKDLELEVKAKFSTIQYKDCYFCVWFSSAIKDLPL